MTNSFIPNQLTDKKYWSKYWQNQMPFSVPEYFVDKYDKVFLRPFNHYLSRNSHMSVLEIGGFPGYFLLDLVQKFNLKKVGILDYCYNEINIVSKSFKNEGCLLEAYRKDLFNDDLTKIPPYDIVYSLGFVEHYNDVEKTTQKHLECLKKNGILIIGMPVFLGINKWLAQYFSPENFTTHNIKIMNDKIWKKLPEKLDVELLYSAYVGGFNPNVHHRLESSTLIKKFFYIFFHKFGKIWNKIPYTVAFNSKYFSYYYYVVFKKIK